MVNTFLTEEDFGLSAKNLDNRRLGKQRVEAMQILNLIIDLEYLSQRYKCELPSDPYDYKDWIRSMAKLYKSESIYIFRHQNEYVSISKDQKPIKIKDKYRINDNGTVTVFSKKKTITYEKYQVHLPQDHLITLGFVYHPAILMWLGYKEALMEYIDAHIEEWENRGFKNNMTKFNITNSPKPLWTQDPEIYQTYKAALLAKELDKKEKPWYQLKPDFIAAAKLYPSTDHYQTYYIWPYNQRDNRYSNQNL